MKNKFGLSSFILTSAICMFAVPAFAASTVRALGAGNNAVVGASNATVVKSTPQNIVARPGASTTGTAAARASSLRFQPSVSAGTVSGSKQYTVNNNKTPGGSVAITPSSRLSIGKYLNLSHTNSVTPTGTGTTPTGGGSTGCTACANDIDALQQALEELRARIEAFNESKQNTLIVGESSGEYITIDGDNQNVINIDIDLLKNELSQALGNDRPVVTELDSNYKLWWCYADELENAASGDNIAEATGIESGKKCPIAHRNLVIDLAHILQNYDLVTNNTSISEKIAQLQAELENKQVVLTPRGGLIVIGPDPDDSTKTAISVDEDALRDVLGLDALRTAEMRVNDDKILQWRYMDEFDENTGEPRWTDVYDLTDLLDNYVDKPTFDAEHDRVYVELSRREYRLTPDLQYDYDGRRMPLVYIDRSTQGEPKIGLELKMLREWVLEQVHMNGNGEYRVFEMVNDGPILRWHYLGSDEWKTLDLTEYLASKEEFNTLKADFNTLNSTVTSVSSAVTTMESAINEINENLAKLGEIPTDGGLYILSVDETDGPAWQPIEIVDADYEGD